MQKLKACADSHDQILYYGQSCPLCEAREKLDEIINAKTDIEEADIFDLYHELKLVQHRIKRVEKQLGITPRKRWWQNSKDTTRTSAEQTLVDF